MSASLDDYRVPDGAPSQPAPEPAYDGFPADTSAERTILGAILLDNQALNEAQARLTAEDFALDSNQRIYATMCELVEAGHSVDIVTLASALGARHQIEAVGGVSYLASLTEGLPRRPAIDDYTRIVKDKALLRRLLAIGSVIVARAGDKSENAAEVLSGLEAALADISAQMTWRDPDSLFVSAIDFALDRSAGVDWLVEGVIQRNGNGIVAADGKTGKSLLAIHLLLHLATGTDWLGLRVPRRVPVALISREDDPGETARRIGSFAAGSANSLLACEDVDRYFWLNTRVQSSTFALENKRELNEMIDALKRRKVEFAVFDVFRSIWQGDENDNREVSKVLESLRRVQREVGCSVCLIHHLSKSENGNGSVFAKLRGASAIRGWQEWGFAIAIQNPEDDEDRWVRCIRFETKAARPHRRMFYAITGGSESMALELRDDPGIEQARQRAAEKRTRRKPRDVVPIDAVRAEKGAPRDND